MNQSTGQALFWSHGGVSGKIQEISKIMTIHLLGAINVWTRNHEQVDKKWTSWYKRCSHGYFAASVTYPPCPAGGASRGLLRPGHAGDDVTLQELHPAHDRTERVRPLPGGAAVRSDHQAGDERTEGPVEGERSDPSKKTDSFSFSSFSSSSSSSSFSPGCSICNQPTCTVPTPVPTSGTAMFIGCCWIFASNQKSLNLHLGISKLPESADWLTDWSDFFFDDHIVSPMELAFAEDFDWGRTWGRPASFQFLNELCSWCDWGLLLLRLGPLSPSLSPDAFCDI